LVIAASPPSTLRRFDVLADPDLDLGERHAPLAVDGELTSVVDDSERSAGPAHAEAKALERAFDPIGLRRWGGGYSLSSF
jgi:hypothetical protein